MPYIIENSSGDSILIPDGDLNSDYSIDLVGRNYENYGQVIAKTQIDLLDNFASDATPPENPTTGQLWYDKGTDQLRVYEAATGSWLPSRPFVQDFVPTNTYGQNKAGTSYYNTAVGQYFVNIGPDGYVKANVPGEISTSFDGDAALNNPQFYGTSIRNINLSDTNGTLRAVLCVFYRNDGEITGPGYYQGEKLLAVISGHDEFTLGDFSSQTDGIPFNFYEQFTNVSEIGVIGTRIKPGINIRTDSTAEAMISKQAKRAQSAYNLNLGTYQLLPDGAVADNGGANISASQVFFDSQNNVPSDTATYNMGGPSTVFNRTYSKDFFVGEGGLTGRVMPNGADCTMTIGDPVWQVQSMFSKNYYCYNKIIFSGGGDIADATYPVTNVFTENLDVATQLDINDYSMPLSAGADGDTIVLGSDNTSYWAPPTANISNVVSTNQDVIITQQYNNATVGTATLAARTLNLSLNAENVRKFISLGGTQKTQESLSYSNVTGVLNYIRTTPFDDLTPNNDFLLLGEIDQTAKGKKTFLNELRLPGGISIGDPIRYGAQAVFPQGINPNQTSLQFKTTNDNLNQDFTITFNDTGGIVAAGDITAFSDERLKENIEVIPDALAKVKQVSGYTFTRKNNPSKSSGVIAQEILKVLPEVVHEDEDGMLSVAYGNMVGLLIEAIKELSDEVAELKKELGK